MAVTGYPSGYANTSDAGVAVKRYFCGNCGSWVSRPLPQRHTAPSPPPLAPAHASSLYDIGGQEPDMYYVHGGLFPPRTLPKPGKEIFLRSAEEWTLRYPGCKASDTEVKELGEQQGVDT